MDEIKVGDPVILVTPDNPRLNGAPGVVKELTEYGAIVLTTAAGSGQFRALIDEMHPVHQVGLNGSMSSAIVSVPPKQLGYSGEICGKCGSNKMRRNGPCLLCENCGDTTGCS